MHSRPRAFNNLQGLLKKTRGAPVHAALRLWLRNVHKSGDSIWATRDENRQKRFEQKLKRQARQLGYELVPVQTV